MPQYIKSIKVNKLFHLSDLVIPVGDERNPHLIITGKNGSGKTVLLKAIGRQLARLNMEVIQKENEEDVVLCFNDRQSIVKAYRENDFLVAFYGAMRMNVMKQPAAPKKLKLNNHNVWKSSAEEFLYFLVNLKIQAALASNEGQTADADNVTKWFEEFENLLRAIYDDQNLKLNFSYKSYTFNIETQGKSFKLTEMADGFSALLEIVADLIMKMQNGDSPTSSYMKKGIILIDEIETHLHLELQKNVMPLITALFPNIQFIVSTHSPFVLSSLSNGMAYDLEHREQLVNLKEYSYDSIAEGYFGVSNESGYIQDQLSRMGELLQADNLSDSDRNDLKCMMADFERIPSAMAPTTVGQYRMLRNDFSERIKDLGI